MNPGPTLSTPTTTPAVDLLEQGIAIDRGTPTASSGTEATSATSALTRFLRRCRGALRSGQRVVRRWPTPIRKLAIALLGVFTLLAGVVMLITPGPGWVTIFLGMGILGTEFRWARRLSGWGCSRLQSLLGWCRGRLPSR